jgi:hypothetical protein
MLFDKIGELKVEIVHLVFPVVSSVITNLFLHLVNDTTKAISK